MNQALEPLMEYFKELGCEELPSINARDAETFIRHRAMCRECQGIDNCKEKGYVSLFSLSFDKKTAYSGLASCPHRKAREVQRKSEKLFFEASIPPAMQKCVYKFSQGDSFWSFCVSLERLFNDFCIVFYWYFFSHNHLPYFSPPLVN